MTPQVHHGGLERPQAWGIWQAHPLVGLSSSWGILWERPLQECERALALCLSWASWSAFCQLGLFFPFLATVVCSPMASNPLSKDTAPATYMLHVLGPIWVWAGRDIAVPAPQGFSYWSLKNCKPVMPQGQCFGLATPTEKWPYQKNHQGPPIGNSQEALIIGHVAITTFN